MKPVVYLAPILSIFVIVLIYAQFRNKPKLVYFTKPISTLIVIAMALLSFLEPARNMTYSVGVLVGLLFSMAGDVALMFQEQRRFFMLGLVFFLLAQIAYALVFNLLGSFSALDIVSLAILLVVGVGFYTLIKPGLGKLRIPVIAYMVVISIMVDRAISTTASPLFSVNQGLMVAIGTVLFYISDMILAANRFWKPWKYERFSLFFYYSGQMLIALAASYFG